MPQATWGCPSPGLQARHCHAAAETSMPVTNPSLCKTPTHLSLCSLLFSIASLNAGMLLVPLTNHCYWDTPTEAALLHKSWKFSTRTSMLSYCFLHPALQKWENRHYIHYLTASFFLFNSQCILCKTALLLSRGSRNSLLCVLQEYEQWALNKQGRNEWTGLHSALPHDNCRAFHCSVPPGFA